MHIAFDLSADDLKHFRLIMREAQKSAANAAPEVIVAAARRLLQQVGGQPVPDFVRERLHVLETFIAMLADHQWRLPQQDATRVLNALAYFCESEDLIPDHIPGLGFLDDAIMIELLVQDLQHELQAYREFCEFRANQPRSTKIKPRGDEPNRDAWLEARRDELQARMHERRKDQPESAA